VQNSKLLIVKKQKKTGSRCSSLRNEQQVLQLLMASELFPRVTSMNQSGAAEYFMMDCFGRNL
jgi:predicted Ser/Thr protein kinase